MSSTSFLTISNVIIQSAFILCRSYRTIDQAKKAIEQANGMFIGNKPVVVMLHIKKDQRRMQKLVMKETLGSTMLPRPGGNMPSHFKMQQALHQHILHENNYNTKGRLSAMGHHTPGHHTPGHHTPGGLGYADHTSRGNFLARQGLAHAHDMADYPREYEREYESKSPESGYMQGPGQGLGQRRNLYPQEVTWDGYPSHGHSPQTESENYMQSLGPLVPQTSPVHYFPQGKKAPSPGDMYGPMIALDKRQRVMQLRSEIYESSRAGHDLLPYEAQPTRLSAPPKSTGLWNERTGEYNAPPRGGTAPSSFLQDQAQWLELGSPATTSELNFSPASWSGGISPRGGPSSPTYENPYPPFSVHKGSRPLSPRTSYALRDSLSLNLSNHSSNQSSMIDQLPDIVSRRTSISSNPEIERPRQNPPERTFAPPGPNLGYSQFLLAEPGAQRSLLSSRLLPLVEAKSSQARKITDYLVQNAPYDELQQLLETPDLLLPHYIAAALSKMGA